MVRRLSVAGRMLVERPPPGTDNPRGISLSKPPPALILGNARARALGEFAVVQAFGQPAVACPGFLSTPDQADGASCTELKGSEVVAGKASTGTTRASQEGVGGGTQ